MFDLLMGDSTQALISRTVTIIAVVVCIFLFLYFFSNFKPVQSLFYGIVFFALIATGVMSFGNLNSYYSAKGGVFGEITSIFEKNKVEIVEENDEIKFDFSNVVLMKNAQGKYCASMTSEHLLRLDSNESYFIYVNDEPCSTVKCEVKDIYATYSYLFMNRDAGEYKALTDDVMTFYFALYDNYSYLYIEVENGEETAGLWNAYFNKNNFKAKIVKVPASFYSTTNYKTINLVANNQQVNKVMLKANSDYILPETLELDGYRFNCWRDSSGNEITSVNNINSDIVITADLTKMCNVTIDADGTITNYTVEAGTKIEKPAYLYKPGYTFKGWVISGTEVLLDFSTFVVNDNVVIEAYFEPGETIYGAFKMFWNSDTSQTKNVIRILGEDLKSMIKSNNYSKLVLDDTYLDVSLFTYDLQGNDAEFNALSYFFSPEIKLEMSVINGVMSSMKITTYANFTINGDEIRIPLEFTAQFSSYTVDSNGFLEFTGYIAKVDITNQLRQACSSVPDDIIFKLSASIINYNDDVIVYKD